MAGIELEEAVIRGDVVSRITDVHIRVTNIRSAYRETEQSAIARSYATFDGAAETVRDDLVFDSPMILCTLGVDDEIGQTDGIDPARVIVGQRSTRCNDRSRRG